MRALRGTIPPRAASESGACKAIRPAAGRMAPGERAQSPIGNTRRQRLEGLQSSPAPRMAPGPVPLLLYRPGHVDGDPLVLGRALRRRMRHRRGGPVRAAHARPAPVRERTRGEAAARRISRLNRPVGTPPDRAPGARLVGRRSHVSAAPADPSITFSTSSRSHLDRAMWCMIAECTVFFGESGARLPAFSSACPQVLVQVGPGCTDSLR